MPQQKVRTVFEVDVPIHTRDRKLHGLHVFTGQATSPDEALTRAHQVYDQALAAREAGRDNPGRQDGGWGACGVRDGWEPDWEAAKTAVWCSTGSFAL
ncbi:hypothetical protein AB0B79_05900 [Streptomyces sp. NPDC039022]|uniref:hypothetical protein n=1 Tax=Streptomyces sp. NPDC039022 TaxID=3157091 RepID=UPI0033E4E117